VTPSDAIRMWWLSRLSAGCQLTDLAEYQIGYDYKGVKPWKKAVAVSALHTDYLLSGPPVSRESFMILLRRSLGNVGKKRRLGWLYTDQGYRFVRPHRNFIYFRTLSYHKAAVTIGGNNASQGEKDYSSNHG
jgi:hypothetical protein